MRILIKHIPSHIKEHGHPHKPHHRTYLRIFKGMTLEAKRNKARKAYCVELEYVRAATVTKAGTSGDNKELPALIYWLNHWLTIGMTLDEDVCFPAKCCRVLK